MACAPGSSRKPLAVCPRVRVDMPAHCPRPTCGTAQTDHPSVKAPSPSAPRVLFPGWAPLETFSGRDGTTWHLGASQVADFPFGRPGRRPGVRLPCAGGVWGVAETNSPKALGPTQLRRKSSSPQLRRRRKRTGRHPTQAGARPQTAPWRMAAFVYFHQEAERVRPWQVKSARSAPGRRSAGPRGRWHRGGSGP
jgi:hypothetical protein